MAGLDDLVLGSQPAFWGGGVNAEATEGRTWRFTAIDLVDNNGDPIDFTGMTGVCKVWDGAGEVITLTVTGGVGTFTAEAAKAATAGKAGTMARRPCRWGLEIDDGTISVAFWAPPNSSFVILSEDGVA